MVRLSIKSFLLATLAIAATAQASMANAQGVSVPKATSTAPVAITYVRVADLKSDEGRRGTIYLSYRYQESVAADDVRFAIRHGQATAEVRDLGLFSPSARIDHRFAGGSVMQWGAGSSSSASVVYVHFVNGTSWSALGNAPRNQARN
jgi:hypothetical protein